MYRIFICTLYSVQYLFKIFFCLFSPLYPEIFYIISQWSCSASGSLWEMPDSICTVSILDSYVIPIVNSVLGKWWKAPPVLKRVHGSPWFHPGQRRQRDFCTIKKIRQNVRRGAGGDGRTQQRQDPQTGWKLIVSSKQGRLHTGILKCKKTKRFLHNKKNSPKYPRSRGWSDTTEARSSDLLKTLGFVETGKIKIRFL